MNLSHTASWRKSNYFGMASESLDKGVKTTALGVVSGLIRGHKFKLALENKFCTKFFELSSLHVLPTFCQHFLICLQNLSPICSFHLARSAEAFRKVCQQTQIESQVGRLFKKSLPKSAQMDVFESLISLIKTLFIGTHLMFTFQHQFALFREK